MIADEQEYRVTKERAEAFERAITALDRRGGEGDPRLVGVTRAGMKGQLRELRAQLAEYEALRNGGVVAMDYVELDEIPGMLIRTRLAVGMTTEELALRAGLSESALQRYEDTNYAEAGPASIARVAAALRIHLHLRALIPIAGASRSGEAG